MSKTNVKKIGLTKESTQNVVRQNATFDSLDIQFLGLLLNLGDSFSCELADKNKTK